MKWISIKDRLPEYNPNDGNVYIICVDGISVYSAHYSFSGKYFYNYGYGEYGSDYEEEQDVTHWMPFPEPPKTKQL